MAQVTLTQKDIDDARQFMVDFLGSTGDFDPNLFAPGTVHHDRTIRALAFIFAYIQSEVERVEVLTDLSRILEIEDETARNQAVDAFATNLFSSRAAGRKSRGTALLHFSAPTTGVIPSTTRVTGRNGKTYVIDDSDGIFFTEADLTRYVEGSAAASTTTWVLPVPIVASDVGPAWDLDPGRLSSVSGNLPLLSYAEASDAIRGGVDAEDAAAFVERIPDLLTVRMLVTPRSIVTVLTETFGELGRVRAIGAGDVEMVRDLTPSWLGATGVHVGGKADIYAHTSRIVRRFRALCGDPYTDTSPGLRLFTDWDLVDRGVDLRALVAPGAVLRFYDAFADESHLYLVRHVDADHIRISEAAPFTRLRPLPVHTDPVLADVRTGSVRYTSVAFDGVDTLVLPTGASRFVEADAPNHYVYVVDGSTSAMYRVLAVGSTGLDGYGTRVTVDIDAAAAALLSTSGLLVEAFSDRLRYSAGTNGPSYDDMIPVRPFGRVTRVGGTRGAVALPATPIWRIREVALDDPDSPLLDPFTGKVLLTERLNALPAGASEAYVAETMDPVWAQSRYTHTLLKVGYDDSRGGSAATLSVDGLDPDVAYLGDGTVDFVDADIGKTLLVVGPENLGNAVRFIIEEVTTSHAVTLRRDSAAIDALPLVFERNVVWRFDATAEVHGKALQVVYETTNNYAALQDMFEDDDNRVLCANMLVRGFFPVYVELDIRYQLKPGAVPLDTTAAIRTLVDFVNTFPTTDVLNVDDVTTALRAAFPATVGNVLRSGPALTARYTLASPTGELVRFVSTDVISVRSDLVASDEDLVLFNTARSFGVSDRTVYVLTAPDLLTLTRVP